MGEYVEVEDWSRKDAFALFRDYDKPYFNVTVRLDVAPLRAAIVGRGIGLGVACYHLALGLTQQQEAFRLRLEGGRVRVHDQVDGGTTVLREDGSFTYARFGFHPDLDEFAAGAYQQIEAARRPGSPFGEDPHDQSLLHFTTVPWLHFTSFSHARNWGQEDSIPKFAFGRADPDGDRLWMPMSVEVHHALMDGAHVGRFVEAFEAFLTDPEPYRIAQTRSSTRSSS